MTDLEMKIKELNDRGRMVSMFQLMPGKWYAVIHLHGDQIGVSFPSCLSMSDALELACKDAEKHVD